mgnify:CR=1 FL=1
MQPVINAPEIATAREQQLFNGSISTTIMNLLWY